MIRLRFLQLYRSSGALGLFRVLLLVCVFLPLTVLFIVQRVAIHPWPFVIPAASLYIVWLVHQRRKDYNFLMIVAQKPPNIFIREYLLFTLPVTILFVAKALYLQSLVFCSILVLISFLVPSRVTLTSRTLRLSRILPEMFEWQSGIRKNLPVILVGIAAGLSGFFQLWLSAGSLLLCTMVAVSCYSEYEPANILRAANCSSWQFLGRKISKHVGIFMLILAPLLLIALVHQDFRLITTGYFIASLNLVTFSILLKYYQYRPGSYSGAHQMITTLACFISVLLPVAVLIVVVNIFLAAGAVRNLKIYLYDNN